MDEISLNIAVRHCRSPLSGGENARLKKALYRRLPALPQKKMWFLWQKKRCIAKDLGTNRPRGRPLLHH
jgi:hypothetical protein